MGIISFTTNRTISIIIVSALFQFEFVQPANFFADFRFTDIKIDTRGFSGTVIPNLAAVLLYEVCAARHFYQDVVNIYHDQKFFHSSKTFPYRSNNVEAM